MKVIGKLEPGPVKPFRTKDEEAAEQHRLLLEDKELDTIRGLPWARRVSYMNMYLGQLVREIENNPRIEPEQRQKLLSHVKRVANLISTVRISVDK